MAGGGLIGKLRVWIGVDNSDYKKGLNQSKQQTSTFAKEVGGTLKSIGGAFAIGAVIKKAFDFSKESYLAAEQARGVKAAFDRLNDPALLGNLKAATKGTVDEMKLMQVAVQAKNFKIPIENLSSYLKFATQRARETGESVDYLVSSIVTGIGRKSPMILDNLGINALEVREEFKKTGDMAAAVANIIEREMGAAGGSVDQEVARTQKFSAAWANFKGTFGETSFIKGTGDAIVDTFTYIANGMDALIKSKGLSWWQKTLGFLGSGKYQFEAINEQDQTDYAAQKLEKQAQAAAKEIIDLGKAESVLLSLQGDGITQFQSLVRIKLNEHIQSKKRAEEERKYRNESIAGLKEQIDEATKLIDAETDPKKRAQYAEELKAHEKKLKSLQSGLSLSKEEADTLFKKEHANTKELAFLKSQEQAYGTTLIFQEKLLAVMREREGFMRSDDERIALKAQNDELERQIKLRKEGLTGIAAIESEISKIEADLKITTDPTAVKKMGGELSGKRLELKAAVIATLPEGSIERLEAELNKIEFEKSLLKQGEQAEWDKLEANAKNIRAELDKFPKEIFPEGSLGYFDAEICKITKGLDKLTGAELAAAQAQIALLNAQKQGVESGYSTEIGVLTAQLSLYESQIETTTGKVREYWEALANDTRTAIAGLGDDLLEWGGLIQSGISEAMRGLGDAIGSGNLDEALQQGILSPMASMLGQLGEQLIAMGIAKLNLDAWAVPFSGPGMIAAGAALVALSQVAQSAMAKTVGSMGQSDGNANTFTGGYSYGSNSPSYATTNGVSRSSEQTIVVKGEVSGDKLRFVLDKDAMRRKS